MYRSNDTVDAALESRRRMANVDVHWVEEPLARTRLATPALASVTTSRFARPFRRAAP
jgi:L-alanine-DL-glutamate epimerase-like enolase superfamily enzyme